MVKNKETEEPRLEKAFHPSDDEMVSLSHLFEGRSLLREILETVLLTLIIFLILNTLTGRFQVQGSSMEPTLHDGQYLLVSKLSYWLQPPDRGDIVVFHSPNNATDDYIKRIIALPGERVKIQNGQVHVNNAPLEEPYVANQSSYSGSWNLEENEYFVLGDNRSNSSDSHTWGALPRENIIGKAWASYWPPQGWGLVNHHNFQKQGQGQK